MRRPGGGRSGWSRCGASALADMARVGGISDEQFEEVLRRASDDAAAQGGLLPLITTNGDGRRHDVGSR